jgi:hypothetical protein
MRLYHAFAFLLVIFSCLLTQRSLATNHMIKGNALLLYQQSIKYQMLANDGYTKGSFSTDLAKHSPVASLALVSAIMYAVFVL